MALRKPLVIDAGQIEQLQAGDTLDASVAGGDRVNLTNDEAGAVVIGAPVYIDANSGFKKAQATTATLKQVVGLVAKDPSIAAATTGSVILNGVLTATTAQWDAVTGDSGGLTFGATYWLSATLGFITKTAPTTIGQYVVPIGVALSTVDLEINLQQGQSILL